jgi:hypothetical protein
VIDVYRQGRQDAKVRLTERPGPLFNGDSIRIHAVFSRPTYAYLYWAGSEGTVDSLYPDSTDRDAPVTGISVPAHEGQGLPIRGAEGTEMCILVLRETALVDGEELLAKLRLPDLLPALDADTLLLDGVPMKADLSAALAADGSGVTVKQLLERLPPDVGSRSVGPAEPLIGSAVAEPLSQWYRELPPDMGDVRYLAIPHLPDLAPKSESRR